MKTLPLNSDGEKRMTRAERSELGQLIRKRERVMKSQAAERAANMLAEFDRSSAQIYKFDDDKTWKVATDKASEIVKAANKTIRERCVELGIPAEFAPGLSFGWYGRGENAVAGRRAELRRMAVSKIKAIEIETCRKIEQLSLTAQTEVIANGLESAAAREFLEKMPTLEQLMPAVDIKGMKTLLDQKHRQDDRNDDEVEEI